MNLSVSWPNDAHYLLQNPRVELDVDGAHVPATMRRGGADFVLPVGFASPPMATLLVQFAFGGVSILRVEQHFLLMPPTKFGAGGPIAFNFTVDATSPDDGPDFGSVTLLGSHPLLTQFSALGLWRVMINTSTVDVTKVKNPRAAKNPMFLTLNKLKRPEPKANVRLFARTDGKHPLRWVTATPPSCRTFADTGVLCFLTAPQDQPEDRDDTDFLVNITKSAHLAAWLGTFLATGLHDNRLAPRGRDHFAPPHDPVTPLMALPNFVLPRGWEAAMMASQKHVALAIPVPSSSSHNAAGTAELPRLLADVHATLVAVGDILAPEGVAVSRRPMLGLAGHSNAGAWLYSAVAASLTAFKEIWLFDTNNIKANLATLELASAANVLFAGFSVNVAAAQMAAKGMPSLSGRIRRLPQPEPPIGATPGSIAASSSILTHALTGAGTLGPTGQWEPTLSVNPLNGGTFDERFQVLHQQIVQGDDADGTHYLTKALTSSAFP